MCLSALGTHPPAASVLKAIQSIGSCRAVRLTHLDLCFSLHAGDDHVDSTADECQELVSAALRTVTGLRGLTHLSFREPRLHGALCSSWIQLLTRALDAWAAGDDSKGCGLLASADLETEGALELPRGISALGNLRSLAFESVPSASMPRGVPGGGYLGMLTVGPAPVNRPGVHCAASPAHRGASRSAHTHTRS